MGQERELMLERYLDGLLSPEERADFEGRLREDTVLTEAASLQKRIDVALSRRFSPPALDRIAARVLHRALNDRPAPPVRRFTLPAWRLLATAAVISVAIVGAYQLWSEFGPRRVVDPYRPQPWRSFSQVYQDTVASGFVPNWVCKDDKEFETAFRRRLGQAMAIVPPPPGLAWAGVDYCHSLSPSTLTVLAYVNGAKVLVFADRARRDKGPTVAPESGLNVFRRQVGELVLYECTPLDQPYLLDLFYVPRFTGP